MSTNNISYLNRTFDDYKSALKEYVTEYYPSIADDFDDASIGSWMIDIAAAVGDNLSFHIDKAYTETNVNTAQMKSSLLNIARTNGVKIPGTKGAIAEVQFSCKLPVRGGNYDNELQVPNFYYAPIIKKGTRVNGGGKTFEVMYDIDFRNQFDQDGVSNRNITPNFNSNQVITGYTVTKTGIVCAGQSKIYKQVVKSSDIVPFMEVLIPDTNVMSVESIIFKDGTIFSRDPDTFEFNMNKEYDNSINGYDMWRFFEVDSLADQYRWGDSDLDGEREDFFYGYGTVTPSNGVTDEKYSANCYVKKGRWIPLTQKFMTEFTDKGYMKVIFGSGECVTDSNADNITGFTNNRISKMVRNNSLGKLPKASTTMFIQYRVGGGSGTNLASGAIDSISYLNVSIGYGGDAATISNVRNSIKVTSLTPAVGGKDAPSEEEIRYLIKYANGAKNRCVTLHDYIERILMMEPRYGCPFRVGGIEENNKVMIYMLGLDNNGKLNTAFPDVMVYNIENYLAKFRSINDYVELKAGKVINLSFEVDLFVDKNYITGDIVNKVINTITDYMDINKHYIGKDIFVGDLMKEISDVDGVINLIEIRVYNETDQSDGYSPTMTSLPVYPAEETETDEESTDVTASKTSYRINLSECDYVLTSDYDSMFEVKYPEKDIQVRVKTR